MKGGVFGHFSILSLFWKGRTLRSAGSLLLKGRGFSRAEWLKSLKGRTFRCPAGLVILKGRTFRCADGLVILKGRTFRCADGSH